MEELRTSVFLSTKQLLNAPFSYGHDGDNTFTHWLMAIFIILTIFLSIHNAVYVDKLHRLVAILRNNYGDILNSYDTIVSTMIERLASV